MLSERSERQPAARSFFMTVSQADLFAVSSIRLVQVHALAQHAWLHSTHVHGRCYTRALTVQRKRTLTTSICALFAGSRGSSSLAIIECEEMREDPRSVDLGSAESDEIGGKARHGSGRLCDGMRLGRWLAANAAEQATVG